MKTRQFYNKNQFLMEDDKIVIFQSYASIIATIKNGALTLGYDWDYSRTTMKHLYLFLSDYSYKITDEEQRKVLKDIWNSANKRATIQKAINNGIIKEKEL